MSLYFQGEEQTLQDILKSREIRVQYQNRLLDKYKNTVVSYKLNIPGPLKYKSLIKKIFDEGLKVFKDTLNETGVVTLEEKVMYKNSGPEYFGVFNMSPYLMKKLTVNIEDTHDLGRVYDFDVLSGEGTQISREELGKEARKCLLCGKNAFECGRSRSHEIKDLVAKIESMAVQYFNSIL